MSRIFSHRGYRSPSNIEVVFTGKKRPLTLADIVRAKREKENVALAVQAVREMARFNGNQKPRGERAHRKYTVIRKLTKAQCAVNSVTTGYHLSGIGMVFELTLKEVGILAKSRGYTHLRHGQGNHIYAL